MICGDFNIVFTPENKNKGDLNPRDISTSQNILSELNLIDPPIHKLKFTWSNGQSKLIWIRLDQFLYSRNWSSLNPRSTQHALTKIGSYHSPICLDFGEHHPRPHNFRFENSGTLTLNFQL